MKQLLKMLLLCALVLTVLSVPVLAEGDCTCQTPCTADAMNMDCPVCGAEGATAEGCAKYAQADTQDLDDPVPAAPEWDPKYLEDYQYNLYCSYENEHLGYYKCGILSDDQYTHSEAFRSGSAWRFQVYLKDPSGMPGLVPEGHRFTHMYDDIAEVVVPDNGKYYVQYGTYRFTCAWTVTWDGNGGTVDTAGATGTAAYKTAITPPANDPTREADGQTAYVFDGWYTEREGGVKVTDFGTLSTDVTYYAHWKTVAAPSWNARWKENVNIAFYCASEQKTLATVSFASLSESDYSCSAPYWSDGYWVFDLTLKDPAKYLPAGHRISGECRPSTVGISPSANIRLTHGSYSVTCEPNTIRYLPDDYSTGSIPADTKEVGASIRLSGETFTREGYRQTGWAKEKNGPQIYNLYEWYSENEDLTLYPCWQRIYTVDIPASIEVKQGGEIAPGKANFDLLIRSVQGYVFASGVDFQNHYRVTDGVGTYPGPISVVGAENDLRFTVQEGFLVWQEKNTDARWSCSDAIYFVRLIPAATPYSTAETEPDYRYEIHPVQVVDGQYIPLDETVSTMTFVNTYTENYPRYTVTVENDGHGTGTATPSEAPAGAQVTLTAAAKQGYVFKEWQVVSGDVTIQKNVFTMPAGNVTVKAVFQRAGKLDNVPKTGDTVSALPGLFTAAVAAALLLPKKKRH